MKPDFRVAFIGAGRMGGALIKGLVGAGFSPERITASDPDEGLLSELSKTHHILTTGSNRQAAAAEVIVLAVKPQHVGQVLAEIHDSLTTPRLIISIAAGVSTSAVEKRLPKGTPVVRVMPNAAADVKAGVSAISGGRHATDEDIAAAVAIFNGVGVTMIVEERLQNAVTALSGSGPAYFFSVVAALAEAGEAAGMPPDTALKLAHETMFGASRMMKYSKKSPEELISMVRSPGGTTAAALEVFERRDIRGTVAEAFQAACRRAGELELKG